MDDKKKIKFILIILIIFALFIFAIFALTLLNYNKLDFTQINRTTEEGRVKKEYVLLDEINDKVTEINDIVKKIYGEK